MTDTIDDLVPAKGKAGRPPFGDRAMTKAEIKRRHRAKHKTYIRELEAHVPVLEARNAELEAEKIELEAKLADLEKPVDPVLAAENQNDLHDENTQHRHAVPRGERAPDHAALGSPPPPSGGPNALIGGIAAKVPTRFLSTMGLH